MMRQDTLTILSSEVVAVKGAKISNMDTNMCGVHQPRVAAQFQLACGQSWFGYIQEDDYTFIPTHQGNLLKDIVQIGWKQEQLYPLCMMMSSCRVKPSCEQTDSIAYERYLNFNQVPLLKIAKKIDTELKRVSTYQFQASMGENVRLALKKATMDLKRVLTFDQSRERV